ncbi:hypothetical protein HYU23_04385 [Candidatus Woesearchaeota archaeon]|nr:hypothetical protein [Candidatus Woesearchaeota archaeon]
MAKTRKESRKPRPFGGSRKIGDIEKLVVNYYKTLEALGGPSTYDYGGRTLCLALGPNVYRVTLDSLDNINTPQIAQGLRSLTLKAELEHLDFSFDLFRALCAKYHNSHGGVGFDTEPYNPAAGSGEYKRTKIPTLVSKGFWPADQLPLLRAKLVDEGQEFGHIYVLKGDNNVSDLVLHTPLSQSTGRKTGYVLRHSYIGDGEGVVAYARFLDDARLGKKLKL